MRDRRRNALIYLGSLPDAPLAQLDRALDFGSSGRGFESLRARQIIQGVAVAAAAPFSFDCEVSVKLRKPHGLQTPCKQRPLDGEEGVPCTKIVVDRSRGAGQARKECLERIPPTRFPIHSTTIQVRRFVQ